MLAGGGQELLLLEKQRLFATFLVGHVLMVQREHYARGLLKLLGLLWAAHLV